MLHFILSWVLSALALMLTARMIDGIHISGFGGALIGALVIAVVNALVRPVLVILTLPITILTLGLFLFVVTGIAFWLASLLAPGFTVDGFGAAMLGGIVLGVLNWILGLIFLRK